MRDYPQFGNNLQTANTPLEQPKRVVIDQEEGLESAESQYRYGRAWGGGYGGVAVFGNNLSNICKV